MIHQHEHTHNSGRSIRFAFFLNLAFVLVEIAGGLLTNSVAILSDALHDLGDSFSLALTWLLNRYSQKEGDERFSYGYRRFSLLGAFLNTIILTVGSIFILMEAIPRLLQPEAAHAPGMMVLALIGISVNGLAAWRLRAGHSLDVRAVALHLLEDVLGWFAILIVSIVLLFADLPILDPVLSILITLYVLYRAIRNVGETGLLFLQGVPQNVDIRHLETRIANLPGVNSLHHTHAWSLDGEHHVLTTHVVVDEETNKEDVLRLKCAIRDLIEGTNFFHVTVEVEYEDESCSMWSTRREPHVSHQPDQQR